MAGTVLLAARLLIALMFVLSGWAALTNLAGTAAYLGGLGLPLPQLAAPGLGLFELGAALLLAVGLFTRPVAAALAVFALVAGTLGHYGQGADAGSAFLHWQAFLKDVAVAGGLLGFAVHGGGSLSLDAWRSRRT